MVCGLGDKDHILRLQGKGTSRAWAVGESVAEAPRVLPWGLPLLGAWVFPRYFSYVHRSEQEVREVSCPSGAPSPKGKNS